MNGYYIIYLSFIDNLQYINNTTLGCQVVKKKKKTFSGHYNTARARAANVNRSLLEVKKPDCSCKC